MLGVIGVLRLPDFYTRLHAMGKCDTLGVALVLVALAIHEGAFALQPEDRADFGLHRSGEPDGHARPGPGRLPIRAGALAPRRGAFVMGSLSVFFQVLIVVCAVAAVFTHDLLAAVAIFGAFSFFSAIYFAILGALDVAFTEAAVGAVITTVFFVTAIFRTVRRTKR